MYTNNGISVGSNFHCVFNSLIAIMRDESKVSVDAQQRLSRPNIFIYTSSGIQLSEIPVSDALIMMRRGLSHTSSYCSLDFENLHHEP